LALRAFIVEDNLSIRESLIEALAELADVRTVGVASDERSATKWLTNPENRWDLAVIDLGLDTGGNGLGVLRACRGRHPAQKVVVLTGTASPDVRRECEALGSDCVFDKSMETDALIAWCIAQSRASDGSGT
jgi:two-component system OmpR family response regulator